MGISEVETLKSWLHCQIGNSEKILVSGRCRNIVDIDFYFSKISIGFNFSKISTAFYFSNIFC